MQDFSAGDFGTISGGLDCRSLRFREVSSVVLFALGLIAVLDGVDGFEKASVRPN